MEWIYCRWDDCGKPYRSEMGDHPAICPACQRAQAWTTDPSAPTLKSDGQTKWSVNDRRFLKSIHIAAS